MSRDPLLNCILIIFPFELFEEATKAGANFKALGPNELTIQLLQLLGENASKIFAGVLE